MIHYVYFSALQTARRLSCYDAFEMKLMYGSKDVINTFSILAQTIRESKDDSFVFILTGISNSGNSGSKSMLQLFNDYLEREKLAELIVFNPPAFTNRNYPTQTKNLYLVVLMSKEHWFRELMPPEGLASSALTSPVILPVKPVPHDDDWDDDDDDDGEDY